MIYHPVELSYNFEESHVTVSEGIVSCVNSLKWYILVRAYKRTKKTVDNVESPVQNMYTIY